MNSAIAVAIGLTLAIILILKKCHPVYALILGAVVSGLMSGWGFAKSYDRNAWGGHRRNTQKVSQNHVKMLVLADFFANCFNLFY